MKSPTLSLFVSVVFLTLGFCAAQRDQALNQLSTLTNVTVTNNDDGSVKTPAYATVLFNGVLVENHFELKGETLFIGKPFYKKYDTAPIKLQAHGDHSEPISFRNIWVRELN